jgi:photosystem II stability/assembly factor-like uncharacterized protein
VTYETFNTASPDGEGRCFIGGRGTSSATMYYSTDNGGSWMYPVPGIAYHWRSIQIFGDTTVIFGMRMEPYGQMMMRSIDGGRTWTRSESTLDHVYFFNGALGWAVEGQRIHRTVDGGAHWSVQYSPEWEPTPALYSLHFVDDTTGWAVGSMGTLLATKDGGDHWNKVATRTDLRRIAFANRDTGWIGGSKCILKTVDGGATWSPQTLPATYQWTVKDFEFKTANEGFLCTDGESFRTTDGGSSWLLVPGLRVNSMQFVNERIGYAVGQQDNIFRTTDGGSSWTEQVTQNEGSVSLNSLCFTDSAHGWAVGQCGTIYRTTDKGETWELIESLWLPTPRASAALDAQHFWTSGANGLILKYDAINATFTHQPTYTMLELTNLQFIDTLHGWAMPRTSTMMLRTTDGGSHWLPVTYSYSSTHSSFHFVDAWNGWLLNTYETEVLHQRFYYTNIHRSTDGGTTWQLASNLNGSFTRVYFLNRFEGLIVGGNGAIMRSTDGGVAWTAEPSGTTASLNAIAHTDHIYVGGYGGVLLRSDIVYDVPDEPLVPDRFALLQNYPNPFNPNSDIRYQISEVSIVKLAVYDILGHEVAVLVNERKAPGTYQVRFEGSSLPSGVYFYRLQAGDFVQTRKLLLVK